MRAELAEAHATARRELRFLQAEHESLVATLTRERDAALAALAEAEQRAIRAVMTLRVRATAAEAERDAAQAEVARLRAALVDIAEIHYTRLDAEQGSLSDHQVEARAVLAAETEEPKP